VQGRPIATNGICLKIDKKWLWLVAVFRIMVFFPTPAGTQEFKNKLPTRDVLLIKE
jgi:hypothetical protein